MKNTQFYKLILMNIEDYLKKYAITKRGFARRLRITESALHKIIAGINSPRTTTAQNIVELTNGEVTFEDLFKKKESK